MLQKKSDVFSKQGSIIVGSNVYFTEMLFPKFFHIIIPYVSGKVLLFFEYSGLWEQPVRRLRAAFPAAQSQASVAESH